MIAGCAIIQLPEMISILHEFVKKRFFKNTWSQTHFSVKGHRENGCNSNKANISVAPTAKEYMTEANLRVEDKLRLILERMDRQELKWNLKFESLKYDNKSC